MRTDRRIVLGIALPLLAWAAFARLASSRQGSAPPAAHTVLITGASRGIGLEFAKEYAAAQWNVIGTARDPATAKDLAAIGARVRVVQLDVTDADSVAALAKSLSGQPIDLLINNAGLGVGLDGGPSLDKLVIAKFEEVLRVNTIGPVRVAQALLPNLRLGEGKTVVNITSSLGSIAVNEQGGFYGYRESKAALDMFTRSLAAELASDGFLCIAMDPGWVKTDMGGPDAQLTPEESVGAMRKTLDKLKREDTGKAWRYDGSRLPW